MRTTIISTIATLVASLTAAPAAQAHFLKHKKHLTRVERVEYFQRSIVHDKQEIDRSSRVLTAFHLNRETKLVVAGEVLWHRAALRWHLDLVRRAKLAVERARERLVEARQRAREAARRAALPRHYTDWLCIHRYEGSWSDPDPPYYGGLQMDWSFMDSYGHELLVTKGTADNWTPLEQMWVAEKAYNRGRGFWPWPNTARYCGLL